MNPVHHVGRSPAPLDLAAGLLFPVRIVLCRELECDVLVILLLVVVCFCIFLTIDSLFCF